MIGSRRLNVSKSFGDGFRPVHRSILYTRPPTYVMPCEDWDQNFIGTLEISRHPRTKSSTNFVKIE